MSTKRVCKSLTIDKKMEIIRAVAIGDRKKQDIAAEYGISVSTLSTILKYQDKIKRLSARGAKHLKRDREALYPDVEACLMKWITQRRRLKEPVSGTLIKEKAERYAKELGHSEFKASNGWMGNFKRRYGISLRNISRDGAEVNEEQESTNRNVHSFLESRSDVNSQPETSRLWSQFESEHDPLDSSANNEVTSDYLHVHDLPVCTTLSEKNTEFLGVEKPPESEVSKITADPSSDEEVNECDDEPIDIQSLTHNEARTMIGHLRDYVESFDDTSVAVLEAIRKIEIFVDTKIFENFKVENN